MNRSIVAAIVVALLAVPAVATSVSAAPMCDGKRATIVGTSKSERLVGTKRADVIVARGGNDKILGRGGADRICAGGGSDIVKAGGGDDRVFAGRGRDTVYGEGGSDRIFGGGGNDTLLHGGDHADVVKGEAGNDKVDGGNGGDVVYGGDGADIARGGAGSDRVLGENGTDRLSGGTGVDKLNGGARSDICVDDGTDTLVNCETADLSVKVDGPGDGAPENSVIDYSIEIKNAGPDAASYSLKLSFGSNNVSCQPVGSWDRTQQRPSLPANQNHDVFVSLSCGSTSGGATAWVTAEVIAHATDPNLADNDFSFDVEVLPN